MISSILRGRRATLMIATATERESAKPAPAQAAFRWMVWPVWFTPMLRARPSTTASPLPGTNTIPLVTKLAGRLKTGLGGGTNMIRLED